ncbi:DUF1543 domain-containing protein [Psychrobacter frigidicola]|uniref:DUF1543 domain-containing protein n=1 Tax=Psychrobacter frigidicola TaxID=45611 RepID=A0A5C7A5I7_9GAMM|nr:DUF1543 domain-containing protein [Psychrobacter frigidicola]TXD97900.1 DUF1543 domain-containing protein [Psychrobacter frigidicola]
MPKLFMIKIGGRPKGRLIEQHDMFFGVGDHIGDFIDAINTHWPEVKNTWHLDAYKQVTLVDGYRIQWQPTVTEKDAKHASNGNATVLETIPLKLFFINLGGYLAGEFEEFHHKLLIVAPTQADAIKQAKQSAFYKQYSFNDKDTPFNAASHIDDKQQVDVDEIYNVNDLLTGGHLSITPVAETETALEQKPLEDTAYIGYLSLKKLRKLDVST